VISNKDNKICNKDKGNMTGINVMLLQEGRHHHGMCDQDHGV